MQINKETLLVAGYKAASFVEFYLKQILIIALVIVLLMAVRGCIENKKDLSDLQEQTVFNDSMSESKVTEWRDRYEEEHSRVKNLLTSKDVVAVKLDSVSKLLNVPPKNITAINKTEQKLSAKGKLNIDTVYLRSEQTKDDNIKTQAYNFKWSDNWVSVTGNIGLNDSVSVYGVDTLNRVDYWKRKWFLGKKTYYSDFTNSNPHIKTTGYNGLQIQQKEKNWSIGLNLSVGYPVNNLNFKKPTVFVGVGLQYKLINF